MDCKHIKREGESCPKNNNCKYPDCLQTPPLSGEGSDGKKNINTNDLPSNKDSKQVLHKAHVKRSAEDFKSLALQKLKTRLDFCIEVQEKRYGYIPAEKFGLLKAIDIIKSI